MNYGFIKTASATPQIRVADCTYNARQIITCVKEAQNQGIEVLCFPELCITGYTCGDLFFQSTLQNGAIQALKQILQETKDLSILFVVGLPLMVNAKLYNCAAVIQKGTILGFVPKTHLPNYNEFYEKRQFTKAPAETLMIPFETSMIPFGTSLLFSCTQMPHLQIAIEICEDVWSPCPPSVAHAMAGATLILNLSASNELVGKADYRRALIAGQSARLLCGYVYADAGDGESTTDVVFSGHNIIAENGSILVESDLFDNQMISCEIDIDRLVSERSKNTTFTTTACEQYTHIPFSLEPNVQKLTRYINPSPFIPKEDALRAERCEAILTMQARGFEKRFTHVNFKTAVIGISGGLDSSLALLVLARAFAHMQRPLCDIISVTMPCFGTTERTKTNAEKLCEALGVTLKQVDITDTVTSNFKDIAHDINTHDVTFENVQARVRTLVLMNLSNQCGGLVVGTGDLSELALGFATYNGDHMSMYGVNASVPKTLVRHIVATAAHNTENASLRQVLLDILDTPVSPELLPAENGVISQQTEEIVGPYELHDFFLYYAIRWAFSPAKVFYLAQHAFERVYDDATIFKWLRKFYTRFFAQQFKRSCLPDGPKVGTVSLSPRGDWRMPSDACCALWLSELDSIEIKE